MFRFIYITAILAFISAPLRSQDFRVQIAAFVDPVKPSYFTDKGVQNVYASYDQMGIYRYFAGSFKTRSEAQVIVDILKTKGFQGASVIDLEEQRVLCGANCPYRLFVEDPNVRNIFFDFGSFRLSAEGKAELERIAQKLQLNPPLRLRIHGYTDGIGSKEANFRLATSRARTARNYLMAQGVRADRIYIKVFGEADPLAPNQDEDKKDLPDMRKWNRRVGLIFMDENDQVDTQEYSSK